MAGPAADTMAAMQAATMVVITVAIGVATMADTAAITATAVGTAATIPGDGRPLLDSDSISRHCRIITQRIGTVALPYYYADNTYFVWNSAAGQYRTVAPPAGAPDQAGQGWSELIVYPKKGQSKDQQVTDRYECYRWGGLAARLRSDYGWGRDGASRLDRLQSRPSGVPRGAWLRRQVAAGVTHAAQVSETTSNHADTSDCPHRGGRATRCRLRNRMLMQ